MITFKKYNIGNVGNPNFDWAKYDSEDYRRRVHDSEWAQEYAEYTKSLPKDRKVILTKEDSEGSKMTIKSISPRIMTDNSIVISCSTTSGYSFPIDIRKDKFIVSYFFDEPWTKENAIDFYNGCDNSYKLAIEDMKIPVVFNVNHQPEIEGAIRLQTKDDLAAQIGLTTEEKTLYSARVVDVNAGGLNVEVEGLICFLPVSQSGIMISRQDRSNIIEILSGYIGDYIDVVVSSKGLNDSIVVSNREYTNMCVKESRTKLRPSDSVLYDGTITGVTYFGLFIDCVADDIVLPSGQPLHFSGLLHTSVMSDKLYYELQNENLFVGEHIKVYINSIVDDKKFNLSDLQSEDALKMSEKRAIEKEKAKELEELENKGE